MKEKINEVELLWESESKNHEGKPFFTVKQSRGYYIFGERVGKDSIFFILFDKNAKNDKHFALIKEFKPPMDTETELCHMTTAFGGSIDMDKNTTYKEICQIEVKEESGFCIDIDRIHFIGKTLVSTQMNQEGFGYIVDVTGIKKTEIAEYETKENNDEIRWMDVNEVMDNGDWKSIYILSQVVHKN